jgi:hypothetical protein
MRAFERAFKAVFRLTAREFRREYRTDTVERKRKRRKVNYVVDAIPSVLDAGALDMEFCSQQQYTKGRTSSCEEAAELETRIMTPA